MSSIHKQQAPPINVAYGIVMQGIRIRLGRSIVTLMGVMLGIAFLMSMLTGQTIRQGVSRETATRAEARRMVNFLVAETGPLAGRGLNVLAAGPLNPTERRVLMDLMRAGITRIHWAGATPPADLLPDTVLQRVTAPASFEPEAAALLVMGDGAAASDWLGAIYTKSQQVVTATRRILLPDSFSSGIAVVGLEREQQPEELQAQADEARRNRFRSGWIIVISLLVTVIGITNAILMSVTERFREIGTMKCLGALSVFIRQMFFIEASLIGFVGSVLGALLGALFALVAFGFSYGFDLALAALTLPHLLLHAALCVAAGIGLSVVAAIYPASVASRMLPASALRSTV